MVAKFTHHPPTCATKPNKCRQYYLTHEYDHYRFITHAPPFQADSVANHSARSTSARQSATNADTYCLTLPYNQVRLIMPPAGAAIITLLVTNRFPK